MNITLTIDDVGINRHPIEMPLVPIGTDFFVSFGDWDNNIYYFTVTGYDLHIINVCDGMSRFHAEELVCFAEIAEKRNSGNIQKLAEMWEKWVRET